MIKFKPLSIRSFPSKGVRRIRISPFTASRIDCEVFIDEEYTLYYSQCQSIEINEKKDEVLQFLDLKVMDDYVDILYIDSLMCSFKTVP